MRMPFVLFGMSVLAALVGYGLTGRHESAPVLLALLAAVAALVVLLLPRRETRRGRRQAPRRGLRPIVVDGSNIMHWNGDTPRLETVQAVVRRLRDQGYQPGVIFDANAGYKLAGRYLDDGPLARALGLPDDQVLVVPKGEPADPVILRTARHLGATVLSNDRFRDLQADFPEVGQPGHVRRGGYRNGELWLDTG